MKKTLYCTYIILHGRLKSQINYYYICKICNEENNIVPYPDHFTWQIKLTETLVQADYLNNAIWIKFKIIFLHESTYIKTSVLRNVVLKCTF